MRMFSNNSNSFSKLKSFYNVGDTFRGLNLFPLIAKELNFGSEVKKEEKGEEEKSSISNTVFVGNIDFRVSRATLRKFFTKFGLVTDVYIVKNHCTKTSKGIAFVKFAKKESAVAAMEASSEEATLDNRLLRIFPAEERRSKRLRKEVNNSNEEEEKKEEEEEEGNERKMVDDVVADPSIRNFSGNILDLDDDVLLMIFGYLNVEDLYEAENVCRRFSSLAIRCWSSKRHLDFRNCFSSFGKRPLNGNMFKTFLKRCGRNLKSLDVSTISYSMDYRSVEIIVHLCSNLETLDLSGVQLTNISLRTLAEGCTKLKSITLQKCSNIGEKGLWWILNKCRDMEYVNITQNIRITGQCFHQAGSNIRTLFLDGCFNFSSAGFKKISTRCSNLTELNINGCLLIESQNFEAICSNCPNISKMDIGNGVLNSITVNSLRHLQHLSKLEDLNLSRNNSVLNDDALRILSGSCPNLKILDISACGGFVTDSGLKHLKGCSKLTTLDVSYLENISDDSLEFLAQSGSFEEVRCKGRGISDTSCESLLNLCSDLRRLDVSGCDMVTMLSVITAFEVVQNRPESGPKLVLVVGGTLVDTHIDDLDDYAHPLLEICTLNLCRGDLMPFDPMFMDYSDNEDDEVDYDEYEDCDSDDFGEDYDDNDPVMDHEREWMS